MSTNASVKPATTLVLELEFTLDAEPQAAWRALVEQTGEWWPVDFFVGAAAKRFVGEPKVGGRWYEDWGKGAGYVWYTITGFEPPRRLVLSGHITPGFGGPANEIVQIDLRDEDGVTRLKVTDALVGQANDAIARKLEDGWTALFGEALTHFVQAPPKKAKRPAKGRRR